MDLKWSNLKCEQRRYTNKRRRRKCRGTVYPTDKWGSPLKVMVRPDGLIVIPGRKQSEVMWYCSSGHTTYAPDVVTWIS